jgi:hypothetical protein
MVLTPREATAFMAGALASTAETGMGCVEVDDGVALARLGLDAQRVNGRIENHRREWR